MIQISNLKSILKDFEIIVKGNDRQGRPRLINGNNKKSKTDTIPIRGGGEFKLRYREARANRILCAVNNHVNNGDYIFGDSPIGDGIIIDRKNKIKYQTEHVVSMDFYKKNKKQGEEDIVNAINKKIDKGIEYSNGKYLVVFSDGSGEFYPNKVGQQIKSHGFYGIFLIAFLSGDDQFYNYSVSFLERKYSTTFTIKIDRKNLKWDVKKYQ